MENFLVMYSTDGIGLLTCMLLAQNKTTKHIGMHGTDKKELEAAMDKIKQINEAIDLKAFRYNLD